MLTALLGSWRLPRESIASGDEPVSPSLPAMVESTLLTRLVRYDQLQNMRHAVRSALVINLILQLVTLAVAMHTGQYLLGATWFVAALLLSSLRVWLGTRPLPVARPVTGDDALAEARVVDRQLRLAWVLAFLSGCVWSLVALLCDGYTTPQSPFYLVVLCGISAGMVTHGIAYSRIPIAFILVPLLSIAACLLLVANNPERNWLAVTVLLYLFALTRSARQSEREFRRNSRLKHEATALATSLQEANQRAENAAHELHLLAVHDALSGLYNRRGFMQAAEDWLAQYPSGQFCLMMMDLDGFKAINDSYGHQAGDAALAEVGRWLRDDLSPQLAPHVLDLHCGRLGGDEFVLLCRIDGPAHPQAQRLGQMLMDSFAAHPFGAYPDLGISVGIHAGGSGTLTQMLAAADSALYAAKNAGRYRYCIHGTGIEEQRTLARETQSELPMAIKTRQVRLHYQPVVGDGGRRIDSFEALLRWSHPVRGSIAPGDIILAASHSGQALALMRHIAAEAASAVRRMRDEGLPLSRVAINISPREFQQLPVDDIIMAEFERQEVPLTALGIEITEEMALDMARCAAKLARLSQAGVNIAADDFGSGYSSMELIRSPYIQRIKIDQSFVQDLGQNHGSEAMVDAALGLGRTLGLDVVAEGIETARQFQTLHRRGCRLYQGHYFAAAMPLEEALNWLRRHTRA